ncbi:MAG: phage minor head protein [Gordonibacter sp.]
MNIWEKELAGLELDGEADVLEEMQKQYATALERVNEKIEDLIKRDDLSGIRQRHYQERLAEQIGAALSGLRSGAYVTVRDYLEGNYEQGFVGALYSLQKQGVPLAFSLDRKVVARAASMTAGDVKLSTRLYSNVDTLQKQVIAEITRGFADVETSAQIANRLATETDIEASIKRNVAGRTNQAFRRSMTIARTEKGRVRAQSALDAMTKAKDVGADVVKQWDSTMDKRTRRDHVKADGQIRELEEPFEVGGYKGLSPHMMGSASQDINCRCVCLQRARAALEMPEDTEHAKWDGDKQCFVDLSDAKSYSEFKGRWTEVVAQSRRTVTEAGSRVWTNAAVSALADSGEVAGYLKEKHGILAMDTFSSLSLRTQKGAVAGIDAAIDKYGESAAEHIKLIAGVSTDEGQFDAFAGTILLNRKVKDAYLVAFHETIHAIDAEKSSRLPKFVETQGVAAYNIHSAKVLKDAMREIGLRSGSKGYMAALTEIFGNSVRLAVQYKDSPGEVVAYALDYEARDRSNKLSRSIAERF